MSAAWTLRDSGHEVTILEKDEEAGGRCRSVKWNGIYLQRGAEGFIGAEENLIELATAPMISPIAPIASQFII
jgi:oxygen-dependent protoporphyrinogen oxidase